MMMLDARVWVSAPVLVEVALFAVALLHLVVAAAKRRAARPVSELAAPLLSTRDDAYAVVVDDEHAVKKTWSKDVGFGFTTQTLGCALAVYFLFAAVFFAGRRRSTSPQRPRVLRHALRCLAWCCAVYAEGVALRCARVRSRTFCFVFYAARRRRRRETAAAFAPRTAGSGPPRWTFYRLVPTLVNGFASPFALNVVITFVQSRPAPGPVPPLVLAAAAGVAFLPVVAIFGDTHNVKIGRRLGVRARAYLTGCVLDALARSPCGAAEPGVVTNLVSVDAANVVNYMVQGQLLWAAALQLTLNILLLLDVLGAAGLFGVGVLVALMPASRDEAAPRLQTQLMAKRRPHARLHGADALQSIAVASERAADALNYWIQAKVAFARFEALFAPRRPRPAAARDAGDIALAGTFSWPGADSPALQELDVVVRRGRLTCVYGPTASGKSSLLLALLGELDGPGVRRRAAYVAQAPWILRATARERVFDRHDAARYAAVVRACALDDDFARLAAGDLTEIGERGATLSGGQRQRLALARAAYADADLYVFDDVLSALDAHVGAHVFRRVVRDLLRGKTVVLATHQVLLNGQALALKAWVAALELENSGAAQRSKYVFFASATFGTLCLTRLAIAKGSLRGSRKVHDRVVAAVLAAPLAWFEATPAGRVLNRCASDVQTIDKDLMNELAMLAQYVLSLAGIVAVILYEIPSRRRPSRPWPRHRARATGRLGRTAWRVDVNSSALYQLFAVNSWLVVRLRCLGALVNGCVVAYAAADLDGATVGPLSYSLA
ncbi:ATPase [Aureococcus anophagefferens]|nr:ATPase [Aureococcus anophagefferens]